MNLYRLTAIFFSLASMAVAGPLALPFSHPLSSQGGGKSSSGAITGRIVSDGGEAIPSAWISVSKAGDNSSRRAVGTEEDGSFRVEDLGPGSYMVMPQAEGYVVVNNNPVVDAPGNPLANVKRYRPGDTVNITMMKGGVITGAVTSSTGEPLVGIRIRAVRVRTAEGRATAQSGVGAERQTDDRGIYRIYGLEPGVYVVVANVSTGSPFMEGSLSGLVPTYHPSSPRDTAVEVLVRGGDEAAGIDIRLRNDRGHSISGKVVNPAATTSNQGAPPYVALYGTRSRSQEAVTYVVNREQNSFSLEGIPDGEYVLIAGSMGGTQPGQNFASPSVPVVVKGADVTGVQLTLAPLGSIAGTVTIERLPKTANKTTCEIPRPSLVEEILLNASRDIQAGQLDIPGNMFGGFGTAVPSDKGEFKFPGLQAGRYRPSIQLPGEELYIHSVTLASASSRVPNAAAREGITLKSGENITGVGVNIAEGAASVRGQVIAPQGASLPAKLRVHLVPVDRADMDNVLRYYETVAQSDGTFTLTNVAPGKYWMIARERPEESAEEAMRITAMDDQERAKLRREAEAANIPMEMAQCQRLKDYKLKYAPAATTPPVKK